MNKSEIYYLRSAIFRISPSNLSNQTKDELKAYINQLLSEYCFDSTKHAFFWKFHPGLNAITIDDSTNYVEDDIFDQLERIVAWIIRNNCQVNGYFYCRTHHKIEFISANGIWISRHLLYQELDMDRIKNSYPHLSSLESIMTDAYSQIERHFHYDTYSSRLLEENCRRIILIEKKLDDVDKKLMQPKTKSFFLKALTYLSLITISSFFSYYFYCPF